MTRILSGLFAFALLYTGGLSISALHASSALLVPQEDTVTFNTQNRKYHRNSCRSAVRCTENCIKISYDEAKKRGGIPCKICRP